MRGVLRYGVYLPALRLARAQILDAHGWLNPALAPLARGERSVCNWDEDALTMAVEASRAAIGSDGRAAIRRLVFASTTSPYAERLGGAVLAEALSLDPAISALDVSGSARAGVSALATALQLESGGGPTLCVASDDRPARPASAQEMLFGAGAVALTVGQGRPIARLLGAHSSVADFVDRFRPRDAAYGFHWEERWARDLGHQTLPDSAGGLLTRLGLQAGDVHHLVLPVAQAEAARSIAKRIGVPPERVQDSLYAACGDIGTGFPLLLLVAALERARPGERILVCGYGQGCDALLFEATDELPGSRAGMTGTTAALAQRVAETNYLRHLVGARQLDVDLGIRGEAQPPTPLSVAWRERRTVLGFIGGRCAGCRTVQFPRGTLCVNPACHAAGEQEAIEFASRRGRVLTCTADHLAFSLRPPVHYGMVEFDGGGRVLLEFADVEARPPETGMAVRMVFRLRRSDPTRQWRDYFWKASGVAA